MQLQELLDGLDNCNRKLDTKIADGLPCKTNKKDPVRFDEAFYRGFAGLTCKTNEKNLVCFDETHSDTAFEMRMSLKEKIQDEIQWMNSECSVENKLHNSSLKRQSDLFIFALITMPIFEPISANITVVIDALESLYIDWKGIWKIIYEAGIKYACESKLCR
ncbi:MAG: hypothetical protein EZS28_046530 [Streblomastix strix]|uniref:Uncharacterized protein n=1 Tax=Streblomastix strix TaxID=222440 RepID=A0A5J4TJJ7_9EUKA|nr:MAG: hypothetical protein EZS28_046530 [Streblomastix strix]